MSVLTLVPAFAEDDDPFEQLAADVEASVRANLIADYWRAVRDGDVINRDWTLYEIRLYDARHPGQPSLLDELTGPHGRAAA
jgi:hypothetical protein